MKSAAMVGLALGLISASTVARADGSAPVVTNDVRREGLRGLVDLGGDYGRLLGVAVHGPAFSLALGGGVARDVAMDAGLAFELGRTDYGLAVRESSTDVTVEKILGRLRIGGGGDVLYLQIDRASAGTPMLTRVGLGMHMRTSVDLWRNEAGRGVFVVLRPEGDMWFSKVSWRANASMGFRF